MKKKGIVICADDYGISPGVNKTILDLAGQGTVSAISCMTVFPDWARSAEDARGLQGKIDIGLHLTLSHWSMGYFPLMAKGHLHALDRLLIKREFARQYDQFVDRFSFPPDFIDGHQHIHQFPQIQPLVMETIQEIKKDNPQLYSRNSQIEFRCWKVNAPTLFKAGLLSFAGRSWKKRLQAHGVPTNDAFLGVFSFARLTEKKLWEIYRFFSRSIRGEKALWMVHPGAADDLLGQRDSMILPRIMEAKILRSREFRDSLRENALEVHRFPSHKK